MRRPQWRAFVIGIAAIACTFGFGRRLSSQVQQPVTRPPPQGEVAAPEAPSYASNKSLLLSKMQALSAQQQREEAAFAAGRHDEARALAESRREGAKDALQHVREVLRRAWSRDMASATARLEEAV